jgi:hypothetical protein
MTSADLSYCLVIFAASAAQCLVAVWAATSTRPWPLRALVACAAIVALIPIRAWWPALVFAMTAALTAAIVAAIRRWHRPPAPPGELGARRFQFRLAHLLILILFVAMVLGLFRHFQVPRWQVALMLPLLGLPLAPVIALAYHSVAGPARWKMAAALVLAIPLSAGLLVWFDVGQAVPIRRWIPPGNNSRCTCQPIWRSLAGWSRVLAWESGSDASWGSGRNRSASAWSGSWPWHCRSPWQRSLGSALSTNCG